MSEPTVKLGAYTGAATIASFAIGFVPDFLQITDMTTGNFIYQAYPNRTSFSNGTAIRLGSAIAQVGAAGNNHFTDSTVGSYVMAMGGLNDVSTSTKQRGFYVGKKLNVTSTKYIYLAMRSGAGEQGGL